MKITCGKRDDILKQKAEYDADYNARKARHDEQEQSYYRAEYDITSLVEEEVKSQLDRFSALQFDIHVSRGRWGSDGMMIRIQCNENNKFDDNVALSWSYAVELNEAGEVTKESSSWSGLKATTPEQMESLVQTVEALKYLNSVDWATVLNKELPKYRDYVTESDPKYDRNKPNFDRQLLEVDVEEALNQPVLLKGKSGGGKHYRGVVWFGIAGETPAMFKVFEIPDMYIQNPVRPERNTQTLADVVHTFEEYAYRVKKDAFFDNMIATPVETIDY